MSHSRLAPSHAKCWVNCTAAPGFVEQMEAAGKLQPDKGSRFADDGTKAHDWAAKILTGKCTLEDVEPAEWREPLKVYIDECNALREGADIYVEEKVPLFYKTEDHGTMDFAAIRPDRLDFNDLKFGEGVPVSAVDNEQVAIYAQSLITSLDGIYAFPDDLPVRIRIIQPRYNGEEKVKLWTLDVGELAQFCERIDESANIVLKYPQYQKFNPSEGDHGACRWCRAKAICTARHDAMQAGLLSEFEVIEDVVTPSFIPMPGGWGFTNGPLTQKPQTDKPVLTEDQVVRLFTNADAIRSLLGHVEDYCLEMATAGRPLPGTKLVQGKKRNRAWTDKDRVVELLKRKFKQDDYLERSLMSPTKIVDELLKTADVPQKYKDSIAALVTRADGPLVITTADDKRPEVKPAISEFSVINDEPNTPDENQTGTPD